MTRGVGIDEVGCGVGLNVEDFVIVVKNLILFRRYWGVF